MLLDCKLGARMASRSQSDTIRQLASQLVTLENRLDAQVMITMFLKYFLDLTSVIDHDQFVEQVNRVLDDEGNFGLRPAAAAMFREELELLMPPSAEAEHPFRVIQGGRND